MADDDNLDIKKRARRRLVGAAALALLAAIVLPMVMDQEPRPLNQDVQIRIPRPDGDNFAARTISPRNEVPTEIHTPVEPESPGKTTVQPGLPAPVPAAPEAAVKPEAAKPVAGPKPLAESKPVLEPRPPVAEPARAEAILSGQVPATAPPAGFVVQLGAYVDGEKAAALRSRLKTEGFNAYTEKVGDKTRVRVGPFPSREAADKVGDRLKGQGLPVVVTAR